ncbi:glycoside hydrolase family 108 protein [Dyella amyloliquefaciens]|uniref:glycoside hydrolase family 108 protein n=1 Tax=Dyella amyloliquefaciens TaxID=1770545 RepID=UPI00102E2ADC|nr:glycosyl hydrolase 108 family protein [Dyella amyloliquefaciens]
MTAANFAACLSLTLVYEGGWSNDPNDPGRATMCGITQAVYDDYRDSCHLPRQSVRLSTPVERATIYRNRYWMQAGCNGMPAGVDYAVFDFAVNSGVGRAIKTLQQLLQITSDGIAGPATLAAVARFIDRYGAHALTDCICQARLKFMESLPGFARYGNGWRSRVMGKVDGSQLGDTGVIDRAWAMTVGNVVAFPSQPVATVKTYNAKYLGAAA